MLSNWKERLGLAYLLATSIAMTTAFWMGFFYPTHLVTLNMNYVGEIKYEWAFMLLGLPFAGWYSIKKIKEVRK